MNTNSKVWLFIGCVIYIGIIGALDVITFVQTRLSLFYILPVFLSSYYLGLTYGIGFSILTALLYTLPDYLHSTEFHYLHVWNVLMRITVYSAIAILTNKNKKTTDRLIQQNALSEKLKEEAINSKHEAEEHKKIEEQFLANMSHEIRTPINAVTGIARLLINTELTNKQRNYVNGIIESSNHLTTVINDILDLSKVKSGKLQIDRFDFSIHKTISSVWTTFENKVKEKNIKFHFEIAKEVPESLLGDPNRLSQVLINLIGNALKFTEKGEVALHVSTIYKDNKRVTLRFSVKDTGIGIPNDKINDLFNSYVQASKETFRFYGGTGLGLSISKQLIELQEGTISVKSKEGIGSEFIFEIPFQISALKQKHFHQDTIKFVKFERTIRILLAEDNELNQLVANDTLKQLFSNVEIDICENGIEVLKQLDQKEYDIILMDVQMPLMDGYTTTKTIRNSGSSYSSIPILAMTASATKEEELKCTAFGMNDFISKPFIPAELRNKIMSQLHLTDFESGDDFEDENEEEIASNNKIDFSFIKGLTESNEKMYRNYLSTFVNLIENETKQLDLSIEKFDFEQIFQSAHKLKPSMNYLSAKQAEVLLIEIEKIALTNNDIKTIALKFEQLRPINNAIEDQLKEELLNI